MSAKKPLFSQDVISAFMTPPTDVPEAPTAPTTPQIPEGYKRNPEYVEKRTKRLQLVLQPSLYERLKAAAEQDNVSVNEYIHSLLDNTLRGE